MTKIMKDGLEQFDGLPISIYQAKFSGTFDLDEEVGQELAYDDVITFTVKARMGGSSITENKEGDIKRTNTLKILDVHINRVGMDQPMFAQKTFFAPEELDDDLEPALSNQDKKDLEEASAWVKENFPEPSSEVRVVGTTRMPSDETLDNFLSDQPVKIRPATRTRYHDEVDSTLAAFMDE